MAAVGAAYRRRRLAAGVSWNARRSLLVTKPPRAAAALAAAAPLPGEFLLMFQDQLLDLRKVQAWLGARSEEAWAERQQGGLLEVRRRGQAGQAEQQVQRQRRRDRGRDSMKRGAERETATSPSLLLARCYRLLMAP